MNTPPCVKNSKSTANASNASLNELATAGISFNSSGGKSYKFLSIASPGWILLMTPSRPAINSAAKHKYGFASGSGKRASTRVAFGLVTAGIRIDAERLLAE